MSLNKVKNNNAVFLVLLLLVAGSITVAPGSALKVTGARIALDVVPGQAATSPIGISIGADEKEGDYAIDVLGFGQSVEDGTYTGLAASADTLAYTARPYITVDKPTVHLTPGGSATVTATIALPAGMKDGGRYAIILVHPATRAANQQTSFATAVAIPVFLTVKGGAISGKGDITGVETSSVEIGKAFTVIPTFWNSGNYHYYGIVNNVTITDSEGKTAATVKTSPMGRAIIPGNLVKVPVTLPQGLAEGNYRMTVAMETQDGEVLAVKTTDLKVGDPAAGSGIAGSGGISATGTASAGSVETTYAPGPGMLTVCIAAALGIFGGMKLSRRGMRTGNRDNDTSVVSHREDAGSSLPLQFHCRCKGARRVRP